MNQSFCRGKDSQVLKEEKKASAETIQTCLDLIESIRTVEAEFGQTVEAKMKETDAAGNPVISAKMATKYLMKLEAKADELGVM